MAGIGFELRKLLKKDTLVGLLQAYAFAGIIGSGPWVLSILGILIIGLLSSAVVVPSFLVTQFQTSVTYLIAISLVLSGGLQLGFTRFVSDRLFEGKDKIIAPNLNICRNVLHHPPRETRTRSPRRSLADRGEGDPALCG